MQSISSPFSLQLPPLQFLNLIPRREAFLMLGGAFSKCNIYALLCILIPTPKDMFLGEQVSSMSSSKIKGWKN